MQRGGHHVGRQRPDQRAEAHRTEVSAGPPQVPPHQIINVAAMCADPRCRCRYLLQYQEPIPCEQLVTALCDIKQAYTQFGGTEKRRRTSCVSSQKTEFKKVSASRVHLVMKSACFAFLYTKCRRDDSKMHFFECLAFFYFHKVLHSCCYVRSRDLDYLRKCFSSN